MNVLRYRSAMAPIRRLRQPRLSGLPRGPFLLPADVREGDGVEIGQVGAYGTALRTGFNGFDQATLVAVRDRPLVETPGYADRAVRAA